ncbi:protein kinase [bacterium]|nr:protein kinase [bacterium]MCI0607411.1 protein kinase [bacterium]
MIGKTLNHFKVLDRLGKGGMGEVYVAEDSKLKRKVALKVLPEEVARDPARLDRFQREAESIAALNHPNIVTIYSIEEADGIRFLTMELVQGETLIQLIPSNGLDVETFLRFSAPVAEALSAAHEKGIIHRDLKPGNIMVSQEGRIKVLDFGLAKLMRDDSDPDSSRMETHAQTEAGIVLGTMPYMSPEQIQGKRLDHRSDIFSLGIIFYEMITGRRPFHGDTSAELISAIMRDTPGPVGDLKAGTPEHLERIIRRCLMKDPRDRYQTARDVYNELCDLKSGSSPRPSRSGNSIAVLPFTNMSADDENEYFCDGLAEELLNALAKIDHLKVAARTSSFSFKNKNANASQIGKALHVKTILEGSVRKSGNRLRITAQLIHAADGYHLWSERYDREMKDIFDVQDEITLAVVDALKVKLFGEEQSAVLKHHTRNPEAHEFYLRGLFYFNRFTPDDFQKASESFRRAIAIDPRYGSAYAGLADAYTELSFYTFSPSETMPKAREAANKALELDDRLAEAHNSLAIIKMYFDWDYAGAEQEFKRAIALNPGSAPIHMWYGWYLGLMGRFDESFKEMQGAQELDPLSAANNSGIGIVFHWSRQPERAIEQFRKVLELNPNYLIARSFLAEAYEQKGDFVSAIATIEKIHQAETNPLTLSTLGYVYAKSGDRHMALEILNEFVKRSNQEYVPAFNFAQIYAGLGDQSQALAWLEKACNERAVWIPFLKVDLKFDPLRSNPRFQELLKKVGFPAV